MALGAMIISIILAVVFIAAAVLITLSSTNLYQYRNTDTDFGNAYTYSTWASVLSWILVALVIIAAGVYIYYYVEGGAEVTAIEAQAAKRLNTRMSADSISGWNLFFLILLIILLIGLGGLSTATAVSIQKSKNYSSNIPQQYNAYAYAAMAAVIALVAAGLVVIWWIVDLIYYFKPVETETPIPPTLTKPSKSLTTAEAIELVKLTK